MHKSGQDALVVVKLATLTIWKVPAVLRQWIPLQTDVAPGHTLLVPLYKVIRGNAHKLYRGKELTATTLVRLTRDVQVVTPVTALGPEERLWEILDIYLHDQRQAWMLNSDGSYTKLHAERSDEEPEALGTHATLMDLTRRRSHLLAT